MDLSLNFPSLVIGLVVFYLILRFLRRRLFEFRTGIPYFIKIKADKKYKKLLAEFKRKHKRKISKRDLFRIVIAASHHTFPVKGKNVRSWTKGKRGHWNRQKVRKYLLEKHGVVKKYIMR